MPLCIDLFCGLGGWTESFLAGGWDCIGFDIKRHDYGTGGYPAQLVLQDVLTLHGSQFRNAGIIVASPPCENYSYMAQPWSRAKAMARDIRESTEKISKLNALFNACFRLQLEASQAAGRHIPLVVENVRGAQPWVGRAMAQFGSFFLWGDVRQVGNRLYATRGDVRFGEPFDLRAPGPAFKNAGGGSRFGFVDGHKTERNDPRVGGKATGVKHGGSKGDDWFAHHNRDSFLENAGIKQGGQWWHDPESMTRRFSSRSDSRKAASAMIAKIPPPLASWVARMYHPENSQRKPA